MVRLKLTAPLQSRDGTLAKGAKMKNLVAEVKGESVKAMKRPGISALIIRAEVNGQGAMGLNGALYVVSGDVLRQVIISPPAYSAEWAL